MTNPTFNVPKYLFCLSVMPIPAGIAHIPLVLPIVGRESCKVQGASGHFKVYESCTFSEGLGIMPIWLFTTTRLFKSTQSKRDHGETVFIFNAISEELKSIFSIKRGSFLPYKLICFPI